jgi:hypothetical protein
MMAINSTIQGNAPANAKTGHALLVAEGSAGRRRGPYSYAVLFGAVIHQIVKLAGVGGFPCPVPHMKDTDGFGLLMNCKVDFVAAAPPAVEEQPDLGLEFLRFFSERTPLRCIA